MGPDDVRKLTLAPPRGRGSGDPGVGVCYNPRVRFDGAAWRAGRGEVLTPEDPLDQEVLRATGWPPPEAASSRPRPFAAEEAALPGLVPRDLVADGAAVGPLPPYPELEVPRSAERQDETLGTKYKFWFQAPGGAQLLFKRGRENEDWSEKVAAEVALLLGLPAARVELASADREPGVVSLSFLGPADQLVHGNELLMDLWADYPVEDRYGVGEHALPAVAQALSRAQAGPPPGAAPPWEGFDAVDQLVGYLLLDALIGNTDRHHENWAVIRRPGAGGLLAPTYDHASCLGRNEPEAKIEARLSGRDPRVTVAHYAARARSALYRAPGQGRPMTTLEAILAAADVRPRAACAFAERLRALEPAAFAALLERVPKARIRPASQRFAVALLTENRRRILEHLP